MLLLDYKPPFPALPMETKDYSKVVYRPGDKVVVTCPEFFERVGYPMSLDMARKIIAEEYDDYIRTLLDSSGLYPSYPKRLVLIPGCLTSLQTRAWPPTSGVIFRAYWKIVDGLALALLKKEGFGGNTREIHMVRKADHMGMEFLVLSKKTVKTGMYDAPWSYQSSYDGEWNCHSGGLINCKTHVILELAYLVTEFSDAWSSGLWIERCNVRRAK